MNIELVLKGENRLIITNDRREKLRKTIRLTKKILKREVPHGLA